MGHYELWENHRTRFLRDSLGMSVSLSRNVSIATGDNFDRLRDLYKRQIGAEFGIDAQVQRAIGGAQVSLAELLNTLNAAVNLISQIEATETV